MNPVRTTRWLVSLSIGCAAFACPSWAQNQAIVQSKKKPTSQAPKTKAKAVVVEDITAQLQAQAAAQAAARTNGVEKPAKLPEPLAFLPAVSTPSAAVPLPVPEPVPDATVQVTPGAVQALLQEPPELLIAQQIHQGQLPCELGASVRIEADILHPGFFHVHGKGFRYRMFPVRTSTGALRLEDKKAGAVWLQLANKSMLMDQKKGRRLADECAHPDQVAYAATMKTNPPPSLIDTTGMGR